MDNQKPTKEVVGFDADEVVYSQVPVDFPKPQYFGAVGGAQPKFIMTEYRGRFFVPGCSPPELYYRWCLCEELAEQLAEKSVESEKGKRSHMSREEILEQYLPRLIKTRWTTVPEARWILRRVAELLQWPTIPSSLEPPSNS